MLFDELVFNPIYLLEKTQGDGECAHIIHRSIHATFRGVSQRIGNMITIREINGTDAPNHWDHVSEHEWQYRTGTWGSVTYTIHILEFNNENRKW